MARSQRKFRQKYNESLDFLDAGGVIASISGFAKTLSMSRTTARLILAKLEDAKLIDAELGPVIRPVEAQDYFERNEVLETKEILRAAFMQWIMQEQLQPGAYIEEVQVATQLRIPVLSVREFLIGLSKFGFFRKKRSRGWVVERMSKDFIMQLLDLRLTFELNSIGPLIALPPEDAFWRTLHRIRKQHLDMLAARSGDTLPFVELDHRLHSLMNTASDNRIMQIFQEAVFFIFYYHYRWDSSDERIRNQQAIKEHLRIIDALVSRDEDLARSSLKAHLQEAQNTLRQSI